MIGLIFTALIGFAIALISRHNISNFSLTIGSYSFSNIPLYIFTISSYMLGLLIAWIIEVPQAIGTGFKIMGLGRTIKSGNSTIVQLQNKIKTLELENNKLSERNKTMIDKPTNEQNKPNGIQNFFHKLNLRKVNNV
jgi:hypothetical protein